MRILVFQHVAAEHPGMFRHFLAEDGHEWVPVELDEGEGVPPLDNFDALWVMGGPMDVWEEDQHPWLKAEKAIIRDAVQIRGMPFFGLCLGHQLLAEALGGKVGPSQTPEIGVMDVQQTEEGASTILLDGIDETFPCLQWHSAEVTRLPEGATVLATSPACAVQAMSWGPRAHSLQFHVEVEPDTVANWNAIPAYEQALRQAMGDDGPARLDRDCAAAMATFNRTAERIYINWIQTTART